MTMSHITSRGQEGLTLHRGNDASLSVFLVVDSIRSAALAYICYTLYSSNVAKRPAWVTLPSLEPLPVAVGHSKCGTVYEESSLE